MAEVEVDEKTGQVDVVRYVAVNDVGTIGNKMVLEGQLQDRPLGARLAIDLLVAVQFLRRVRPLQRDTLGGG